MLNAPKKHASISHYKTLLLVTVFGAGLAAAGTAEIIPPSQEPPAEMAAETAQSNEAAEAPSKRQQLLGALMEQYRQIETAGGWPAFTVGKKVEPGRSDARIPALRAILRAQGDWQGADPEQEPNHYDTALSEAVKLFQERHGLEPDGVLGKDTQQALAVPVRQRIEQIAVTMERLKEEPVETSGKYVVINLPGYELEAIKDGQPALRMKVIVGQARNKTPLFSKEITAVAFNPAWTVPGRIAAGELLPKIRKDPGYLRRAGFHLIESGGGRVDPDSVDWASLESRSFNYTLRQSPGRGNALGKVKFYLPDSSSIYLHSTSQPNLFSKSVRALSHGCIRLEKPRDLVHFVMGDQPEWDAAKIDKTYDASSSRQVAVDPVPVHIVYRTAWVDESTGRPHFRPDVYGYDRKLLEAMKRRQEQPGMQVAENRE